MLQTFLDLFLTDVPLQLPELLDKGEMKAPIYSNDSVLLIFPLSTGYDLEDVMDMLEDDIELILLYHHIPSRHTNLNHSTCAYSNPAFGHMFKINASTNDRGEVREIRVTIYADLDDMCSELCHELATIQKRGFTKYCRTKDQVLLDFM